MEKQNGNDLQRRGRPSSWSVLAKIVLLQLGLIAVILVLVSWVMGSAYRRESMDKLQNSSLTLLGSAGSQIESSLSHLEGRMDSILSGAGVNDALTSGEALGGPEALGLVDELYKMGREYPLAREVRLLVPGRRLEVSSRQTIRRYDDPETDELAEFLRKELGGDKSALLLREGELWFAVAFPAGKAIALMAARIDGAALKDLITPLTGDLTIYPYLGLEPALPGELSYPAPEELLVTSREDMSEYDRTGTLADGKGRIVSHTLSRYRLTLAAILWNESGHAVTPELLREGLAVIAGILLALVGASAALVRMVYTPVQEILSGLPAPRPGLRREGRNEFDIIKGITQEQDRKEKHLMRILSEVSGAVEEKQLVHLLNDQEPDSGGARQLLQQLQSPLAGELQFFVVLAEPYRQNALALSETEAAAAELELRRLAEEFWEGKAVARIPGGGFPLTALLGFSEDVSLKKARAMIGEFRLEAERALDSHPLRLRFVCSRSAGALPTVRESWEQAMEQLLSERYYGKSSGESESSAELWEKSFRSRLEEFLRDPDGGEGPLREMIFSASGGEDLRRNYRLTMDSILEYLTKYSVTIESRWKELARRIDAADPEAGAADMEKLLEETLPRLRKESGRIQQQYLTAARQYIQQHYDNCNISLLSVSESVGISKGYLSRLFVEIGEQSFTEYLNQYRVEKACELLRSTGIPIIDVGFKTGFNSPQNFNRVFKKYMQMTPKQFKYSQEEQK